MGIRVYDAFGGSKEAFVPRESGRVGIYVCGVTPYSDTHIGHARPSVIWDVIRRYLEYKGYQVNMVQNFTDVDDKIIARAAQEGVDPIEMAEQYMERYLSEMAALGVKPPTHAPRATEHVDDMIAMVETLIKKGHAYESNGDVYFDIASFPGYGRLSNQPRQEMLAADDDTFTGRKRNPGDFALWKSAKPGEPSWSSPWGPGRPGWHIECSAMSIKYLGPTFDFHGGGTDLTFPHHENEIAQSEAFTGCQLARYWVHHGMIRMNGEKMSKSLGNVVQLRSLLDRFPGQVVRYYLLTAHYRKPLMFEWTLLDEAQRSLQRWSNALHTLSYLDGRAGTNPDDDAQALIDSARQAMEAFESSMDDDFNTPRALAAGFELIGAVNDYSTRTVAPDQRAVGEAKAVMGRMCEILGIEPVVDRVVNQIADGLVELLIWVREELRTRRDWALADQVRDRLSELGVVLEDTAHGTRWKWEDGPRDES